MYVAFVHSIGAVCDFILNVGVATHSLPFIAGNPPTVNDDGCHPEMTQYTFGGTQRRASVPAFIFSRKEISYRQATSEKALVNEINYNIQLISLTLFLFRSLASVSLSLRNWLTDIFIDHHWQ